MSLVRVLSTTQVFPNAAQPVHGLFTRERLRHLAAFDDVEVVAPLPYFPRAGLLRRGYRPSAPYLERHGALRVWHPRFFNVPGLFKFLDGLLYFVSSRPVARRLHRREPFDVVDAHFTYPDSVGAALLARSLGVPLVVTVRGGNLGRVKGSPARRTQVRWALGRAERVITVSASLRWDALELGATPERVVVIPNGVDGERFRPMPREQARAALRLAQDGPLVVSVGHLVRRKRFDSVIEVLPRLAERHPGARYVIAGGPGVEGDARTALERAVRACGMEERVVTVGVVPHDVVPLYLNAADVCCLPSREEGCPNVILEALACGTPVVASRVGGVEEVVDSDGIGILVAPGDRDGLFEALDTALTRQWDRDRIAGRVAGRGWGAVAAAVHGVLAEAVNGTGVRGGA